MMKLSLKVEYALIALLELSGYFGTNEPQQIKQIALKHDIPERYLEQIFSVLRHSGLIRSLRGNKGGYLLARHPWQITVLEVVTCLEEPLFSQTHRDGASVDQSIVRDALRSAQQHAQEVLKRYTLQDLHRQRELRQQLNMMYHI